MKLMTFVRVLTGLLLITVTFPSNIVAANLLLDPGFELSTPNGSFPSSGYWQSNWLGTGGGLCTSTGARTGGAGLWEYTGNPGTEWWSGQYQDVSAGPGDVFIGSAWVRSQSSWPAGSKALVRIELLDASTNLLTAKDTTPITTASSGWIRLSVQTDTAPTGTTRARFRLYLEKPSGTTGQSIANFDDCNLEKVLVPSLAVRPLTLGFGNDLTSLSLSISNRGTGTLTWIVGKDGSWMTVTPTNGTTTETDTVTVTVNRTGLQATNYSGSITINSDGGSRTIPVFLENTSAVVVPNQPAIVAVKGYQLMVQRRLPNGSLDSATPYIIKGAAWAPSSIGTTSAYSSRRAAFGDWYRLDIQLLKEMNANTLYVFLDPGTDVTTITTARAVLDHCYRNGIMVIMTVDEDGTDNAANISQVINSFKNHPAILMWALGNEWNLWRPDRPLYYAHYTNLATAALAMQTNALSVKSLDANHPVASILGEINYPTQADVSNIVNQLCPAVDVWGANIYRGPEFYALFTEWKGLSKKPLFLSEFGTDAFHSASWWPVVGSEDLPMQAAYLQTLWSDLAQEFSAQDASKVCLGGTVFEWNDEWWKTSTGSPLVHDPDGYETTWNPIAHPDGFANEEWFGVVSVDRERRVAYYTLQTNFAMTDAIRNWTNVAVGQVSLAWVAQYNGPGNSNDVPVAMAVDEAGNVCVVGQSSNGTNDDYALLKYDANGSVIWIARFSAPSQWLPGLACTSQNTPAALALDKAGNIYVTGTSTFCGHPMYATVKYDTNGHLVWAVNFCEPNPYAQARASALAVDSVGNVAVTGQCYDGTNWHWMTIKYDSTGNGVWTNRYDGYEPKALAADRQGNVYVTGGAAGNWDYATVKYSSSGAALWTNIYDSGGSDTPVAMSVDNAGYVYVTGYAWSSATLWDIVTLKYQPNGQGVWTNRFDGPSNDDDVPSALAVDRTGNVYVTGYTRSGGYFCRYITLKYGPAGNQLWARTFSEPSLTCGNEAKALALDEAGNVYVTGNPRYSCWPMYGSDLATLKYDANGVAVWTNCLSGPAGDSYGSIAASVVVDCAGSVIVAGSVLGSTNNFDFTTVKYLQPFAPSLTITRFGTNVLLSWPGLATNVALETRTNIASASPWTPVPSLPAVVAGRNVVTNRSEPGRSFYRLRSPR